MTEWIKCSDRNPDKNGKYLSWNGRNIEFQYFIDGYWLMSIGLVIRYDHGRIPFQYWMSLPEPPEDNA